MTLSGFRAIQQYEDTKPLREIDSQRLQQRLAAVTSSSVKHPSHAV